MLPAFMEVVPEYEVRDGRMHIKSGELELVMSIKVFLMGCARGRTAIDGWQREKRGEVIRLEDWRRH